MLTGSLDEMNLCSDSGYSAKTKQAFNDHFAKHENEKLVCDLCGNTFDTPGRLRSHKLVYHGDKDYSCEKCEKHFLKNITLGDTQEMRIVLRQKTARKRAASFVKFNF